MYILTMIFPCFAKESAIILKKQSEISPKRLSHDQYRFGTHYSAHLCAEDISARNTLIFVKRIAGFQRSCDGFLKDILIIATVMSS